MSRHDARSGARTARPLASTLIPIVRRRLRALPGGWRDWDALTESEWETSARPLVEAIAAGGRDNGAPGLRPHYHENYYGAFILDPDGHNIEAVCHLPEG